MSESKILNLDNGKNPLEVKAGKSNLYKQNLIQGVGEVRAHFTNYTKQTKFFKFSIEEVDENGNPIEEPATVSTPIPAINATQTAEKEVEEN